ncbi:helix-turn-helix transcriptional regulator [Bradyrhizobium betae]|uniref:WYL domain-containing protein n=1 Tax=Bradyrhizobium betae TaxID=244734 RepID=A0A5P6P7T4_9BRAD|nr:WYL domain-containing protein [Bradyrhizobium betae]MCS3731371.1 putative DNA-binding transcriptional regulator YafY [Bradyrhizobium betae]QFI73964.1 WYL domain-containing protein [Bradyrhizobium betae]
MRYEKLEALLRVALDMRASAEGISLEEIQRSYGISRRTAERMRDAIERVFPQMEQANPGEVPKRWRIRSGPIANLAGISTEELAALSTAAHIAKRDSIADLSARLETLAAKLKSLIRPESARRIGPDLEALMEAEGIALRPGPRLAISNALLEDLRHTILACKKIRLHYRARGTGKLSHQLVCPYGFLYGNRHYLVAYSLEDTVNDYRLFSLANIEKLEVHQGSFRRRKDFSLQGFAERSFGVFQEDPLDVVWRFTPQAAPDARQYLFHPAQAFEDQPDGSLLVRFRAGGALEMCWHLFTWGDQVRVVEPTQLRALLQEQIRKVDKVGRDPGSKRGAAAPKSITPQSSGKIR